jgi:DNA-dependent RNA polymerase auxiliary subunit epsilon
MINDELKIYRGEDYIVSKHIKLHQPTLNEICDYGEREYYNMINTLTSVGADLKWQLDEVGIDYTKVDDYWLFCNVLIKNFKQEQTKIIFGELDFHKFFTYPNDRDEVYLIQEILDVNKKKDIVIFDRLTYIIVTDFIRKVHGLKKNEQIPANETTRRILIEDDKEEYLRNKDKEKKSYLLNLISSMINSEGFKYNHSEVWNMKIYSFMDSVKRINKIKNADLLLQSGYSGYGVDLKKIDNKQLEWTGELD